MKEMQDQIKAFNDARDWSTTHHIKDLLLNMTEEIGEFWNLVKWVGTETQDKILSENKAEVEDFIGDMAYLVLKVAYLSGVDAEKSTKDVLAELEKRFPVEIAKGKHGNMYADGIDLKYEDKNDS